MARSPNFGWIWKLFECCSYNLYGDTQSSKTSLNSIHEDIIAYNILIRLPVKSVGRFKCVSKSWRSLLSSPNFARAHLDFHMDHEPEGSILLSTTATLCTVNLANENYNVSRNITIPSFDEKTFAAALVSSCHGLVLIRQRKLKSDPKSLNFQLLNPITLETLEIPIDAHSTSTYGLGYDSLHDDYKIVTIFCQKLHNIMRIYSVRRKSWSPENRVHYKPLGRGSFVNGCIHWVARASGGIRVVAAFNVAEEKFKELHLPKGLNEKRSLRNSLTVLGGRLALRFPGWDSYEYWVMKDYGVQDSWKKFTFTEPDNCCSIFEVGVLGEDEVVFINEKCNDNLERMLVAYNMRDGILRDIINAEFPISKIHERLNFKESLISIS